MSKKYRAFYRTGMLETASIPDDVRSIEVELSEGRILEIELFERDEGRLTIRTKEGYPVIFPHSTNVIGIANVMYDDPVEIGMEGRRKRYKAMKKREPAR